jgi:hypothetical protein
MNEFIKEVMSTHHQFAGLTCSASAHEFIAKLHKKISPQDFPLQNAPDSDKAGFQFQTFLAKIGFVQKNDNLLPDEAFHEIKCETSKGRFPLVAIYSEDKVNIHIVVAVQDGNDVVLVDPAKQSQISNSDSETLDILNKNVNANASRPKINFLTYTEA